MAICCPNCGSKSVKSRVMVTRLGTSVYSGGTRFAGISFSKRGSRPWVGGSSISGARQSVNARDAGPLPLFLPIWILILATILGGQEALVAACLLWFILSISSRAAYNKEWLCNQCGDRFIPESLAKNRAGTTAQNANLITTNNEPNNSNFLTTQQTLQSKETDVASVNNDESGKGCSICGKWFQHSEFHYGNRENNSYCTKCKSENSTVYNLGGTVAATAYREKQRAKWLKAD